MIASRQLPRARVVRSSKRLVHVQRGGILVGWALTQALVAPCASALEGRVVDREDGRPVANAEVTVVGRTHATRTDPDGRFVLVPDPAPPFELLVVLPGGRYASPILVDELPAQGPVLVEVAPMIDASVTVGPGAHPGIQTAPANGSTLVSRDDLRARQPQNLAQALENTPGVSSASEGQAAVPTIRGLAQGRSVILIDGARVTAERRIGPSATYLDPFVLESVAVARGPGSVAYGSDAFGGLILARTRRPRPGGDLAFRLAGTLGSGVPQGRAGFEVESGITAHQGVLFAAHYREFEDYHSPAGEVPNSGNEDRGYLARYVCVLKRGVFSLGLQEDRGRDIERPRTDSEIVRFYYPREDSTRLTASYESGPVRGLDAAEIALFLGDYRLLTDQDRVATATDPRQIARADVSARDFGLRAVAAKHWGQTRLDFGAEVHGRWNLEAEDVVITFDSSGERSGHETMSTVESAQRIDSGLFVSAEGAVGPVVSVAAGLRIDRSQSENEGGFFGDTSRTESQPAGFASLTLGPFSGFSWTLQAARGFRDARLSDRYFRGVTGAGFITGNPDLESETSDQFDLALRHTGPRWRSAIYLYDYRIDDLIERYEDESREDFFFFRNHGRARIRGVEIETQAELRGQVTLHVVAGLAEGETRDDGLPLDDIQPESLAVRLRKGFGERGFFQVRGAYFGQDDEPGPNEVASGSYELFDATLGWKATPNLELQLLLRNLLDESYALGTDRRSPVAPGVSGSLSALATF